MLSKLLPRIDVAARASDRTYRGLAGAGRYFLYLTGAGTGFRASALSNLTPADFDLAAPTVTLAARFNKTRRTKVQPLPADIAAALRDYLDGKPANAPIWGGTWARDHRGAAMLRIDLDAASIAYAGEGPDGPEYADVHSLRHSYLTRGAGRESTCVRSKNSPVTRSRNSPPATRTAGCTIWPGRWTRCRALSRPPQRASARRKSSFACPAPMGRKRTTLSVRVQCRMQ